MPLVLELLGNWTQMHPWLSLLQRGNEHVVGILVQVAHGCEWLVSHSVLRCMRIDVELRHKANVKDMMFSDHLFILLLPMGETVVIQ